MQGTGFSLDLEGGVKARSSVFLLRIGGGRRPQRKRKVRGEQADFMVSTRSARACPDVYVYVWCWTQIHFVSLL